MENKEFKKLQLENEILRDEISKLIKVKEGCSPTWLKINDLINNEIEQEEFCNI